MVNRFMKSYAFCSFFFKVLFSSSSIIFSRFSRSISSNMAVPLSLGSTRRYFSYCCIACSFTKSASVCTSSALSDFLFSKFRTCSSRFCSIYRNPVLCPCQSALSPNPLLPVPFPAGFSLLSPHFPLKSAVGIAGCLVGFQYQTLVCYYIFLTGNLLLQFFYFCFPHFLLIFVNRQMLFMRSLLQPFHLVSFHNLCKTLFLTLHPAFPLGVKPPHPDKSLCLQRSF